MKENKNVKKVLLSLGALVVVIAVLFALYKGFAPKPVSGAKEITVTVVHGDESSKDFTYQTEEEFLGPVIKDAGLVEGEMGDYGLFITSVDGEQADDSKQQWWCLTKEGGQVNTSADQTPIQDGERYELTLKEGY